MEAELLNVLQGGGSLAQVIIALAVLDLRGRVGRLEGKVYS